MTSEFSVSWIAYLCCTRRRSNLQGNASWEKGRHDPPYVYYQQGKQKGYREIVDVFFKILKKV